MECHVEVHTDGGGTVYRILVEGPPVHNALIGFHLSMVTKETKMNKNSLILLVTTFAFVLASLACGSTRRTTTTTYQSSPTDTTSNIVPPEASKPSELQSTATLESQINLEIRNYTSFVDWIGSRRFVGEIVNTGNAPAKSVDVALSLLDNNGNVAAVGQTYLSFVPANGKFPFSLVVEMPRRNGKM
jgi:hypothetical protein